MRGQEAGRARAGEKERGEGGEIGGRGCSLDRSAPRGDSAGVLPMQASRGMHSRAANITCHPGVGLHRGGRRRGGFETAGRECFCVGDVRVCVSSAPQQTSGGWGQGSWQPADLGLLCEVSMLCKIRAAFVRRGPRPFFAFRQGRAPRLSPPTPKTPTPAIRARALLLNKTRACAPTLASPPPPPIPT